MTIALPVLTNRRPVLGTFRKGVTDSFQLSFSLSGGINCDVICSWHPDRLDRDPSTPVCYAYTKENNKWDGKPLFNKLVRHEEIGPEEVCLRAINEIRYITDSGIRIPWLRISAFGSVPKPEDATEGFTRAFKVLIQLCQEQGIPVHFPVESVAKRDFYQDLLGSLCVVRLSAQNVETWLTEVAATSFVVGDWTQDFTSRVADSVAAAKVRSEVSGRKTIVCPSIAGRNLGGAESQEKSKCGNCTACAEPHVDVVYPAHA